MEDEKFESNKTRTRREIIEGRSIFSIVLNEFRMKYVEEIIQLEANYQTSAHGRKAAITHK